MLRQEHLALAGAFFRKIIAARAPAVVNISLDLEGRDGRVEFKEKI